MNSLARLLALRDRSVQEVRKRLSDKGFSAEATASAIERALDCGLLDDQRFAQDLIKDKLSLGWGRLRIDQELYRFGIAKTSIEGYPEAFFTEESELEQALKSLQRHHSRAKNPRQAAYSYLLGKGYSSSIAGAAIRTFERES